MRFDPHAPAILVEVELEGDRTRRTVDMLLDTGATYLLVSWSLAAALGYDPVSAVERTNLATVTSVEAVLLFNIRRVLALGVEVYGR